MPYYAVSIGRRPGIYSSWDECRRQVDGYSGARYKKFGLKQQARNFVFGGGQSYDSGYFYAVRIGREPGIYSSWDECREQVEGYPGAKFKKFSCEEDAQEFIEDGGCCYDGGYRNGYNSCQFSSGSSYRDGYDYNSNYGGDYDSNYGGGDYNSSYGGRDYDSNYGGSNFHYAHRSYRSGRSTFGRNNTSSSTPVVYIDGCCYKNGRPNARAGIGIYWGKNHRDNVRMRLQGHQTNNRAEIAAATHAINTAKERGMEDLVVVTDSRFLIKCATKWMDKWKSNGWRTYDGSKVKNKSDLLDLDQAMDGMNVTWKHVHSHTGNAGNEAADRLANEGARRRKY